MADIKSSFSAVERAKLLDKLEKQSVNNPKPKKKKKPEDKKNSSYKVPDKYVKDREAQIEAARQADLRAIAAKRAGK